MTYHIDIAEAPAQLLELIRAAEQGEDVVITKNQQPVIKLVSLSEELRPHFGSAQGKVHMREDFDAPLDEFKEYGP